MMYVSRLLDFPAGNGAGGEYDTNTTGTGGTHESGCTVTDLRKRVARVTINEIASVRRRVVCALDVGDTITFREHGRRRTYSAPIGRVFVMVAKWTIDAERAAKKAARKAGSGSCENTGGSQSKNTNTTGARMRFCAESGQAVRRSGGGTGGGRV